MAACFVVVSSSAVPVLMKVHLFHVELHTESISLDHDSALCLWRLDAYKRDQDRLIDVCRIQELLGKKTAAYPLIKHSTVA